MPISNQDNISYQSFFVFVITVYIICFYLSKGGKRQSFQHSKECNFVLVLSLKYFSPWRWILTFFFEDVFVCFLNENERQKRSTIFFFHPDLFLNCNSFSFLSWGVLNEIKYSVNASGKDLHWRLGAPSRALLFTLSVGRQFQKFCSMIRNYQCN